MPLPPPDNSTKRALSNGFTLIELSVVLVIIGLIVGGVLVGRDLVKAAEVRATITQVEKFNQAANTFFGKYRALPGDLNAQVATTFGFTPRGQYSGEGDGNGIIEGNSGNTPGGNLGFLPDNGEEGMFWVDLTTANGLNLNLIDGNFSAASPTVTPSTVTGTALSTYYPVAKLGQANYFYVYSRGSGQSAAMNFFGLSAVTSSQGQITSNPGLTVKQAYDIDRKIDDGLPQSGAVTARYLNWGSGFSSPIWAGTEVSHPPYTSATAGSAGTCFDNGNVNGATQQYSVEVSNGSNVNCALSFQMQAGD